MTCGIYKITKNETGRCYIGQSKNVEERWKAHHKRFPSDLFSYEILLVCDKDYLNFFEKAFIDGYDSNRNGFNKTIGGVGFKTRYHDEETRQKMSEAAKGRIPGNKGKKLLNEEARQKMSDAKKGKKRGPFSEETKTKMKEAVKRRKPISEETRAKMSESAKRRKKNENLD